MSVPAQHAPLAAQALQRVGYLQKEKPTSDAKPKVKVQLLLTSTARPLQPSNKNGQFDLHLDIDPTLIPPSQTKLLSTGTHTSLKLMSNL